LDNATPGPALASAADIPSLDRILNDPAFEGLLSAHGRTQVTGALRAHLAELREAVLAGTVSPAALQSDALADLIGARLANVARPRMRPVFNLSGTVLHTNLGRALLPDEAVQAVARVMSAPVNLEFDLETGSRGDRDSLVEDLLCELTGAEAATVVNNNAAAVLLLLNTFANRREVIVSRGELIEIGGSFRIPDIMQRAGAKLVEVGTTNRTHVSDYADAIGPRTGLLMKVHASNYAISGFVKTVTAAELAEVGRSRGIPLAVDLGSGTLVDLTQWQLPKETTARETIAAGADLVAFSADKLLGGPQAGILVGRADLIRRLRKNPLKRALRVGKLTLAALEPVLQLYKAPEFLAERLTTLRLLTRAAQSMLAQSARLQPVVQRAVGNGFVVSSEAMFSQIGSGALPIDQLPSHGLAIRAAKVEGRRPRGLDKIEAALRALPRPVIARLADQALWLDLRCLDEADEAAFVAQCSELRM
jgi:L-seryl-tRNA(Ser) seleniumtransferase